MRGNLLHFGSPAGASYVDPLYSTDATKPVIHFGSPAPESAAPHA